MELQTWTRTPFDIRAVQVTEEDMEAIAQWCNGKIYGVQNYDEAIKFYIQFKTIQFGPRIAKAFVGDWVILDRGNFKHYRDGKFQKDFNRNRGLVMDHQLLHAGLEDTVWIINPRGTDPVFLGPSSDALKYLEENPSEQPRGVYISNSGAIMTESEFLDLEGKA